MRLAFRAILLMAVLICCTTIIAQNRPSLTAAKTVDLFRPSFRLLVAKARRLEIASYRVGFGLQPGEFYEVVDQCLRVGTKEEIRSLFDDADPIIRVLGLICLAKLVSANEFVEVARPLYVDFATLKYTNGCILDQSGTVGEIAKALAEGRFFLVPEK